MPYIFKETDPEMKEFFRRIVAEMNKAAVKHPVWPKSHVERAAIISEEAGEIIREANHLREGCGDITLLENEIIQTSGVCLRMLFIMKHDAK